MSTISIILTVSLPILALVIASAVAVKTMKKTGSGKKAFAKHLITLGACLVLFFALSATVSAATTTKTTTDKNGDKTSIVTEDDSTDADFSAARFIGAALAIGISAIGAGIALSGSAPAAIGAVAEDPKSFGKAIIFVVLGEAIAIYGLIISFLLIIPTM